MKDSPQTKRHKVFNVVIFTGGLAPDIQMLYALVQKQDIDFVIAADSGLYVAINNDITPDIIIGDFDSLEDTSILSRFQQQKILRFQKDKDFTDTQLALLYAKKTFKKNAKVYLFGGDGGRFDHLLCIYESFCHKYRPDIWLTKNNILYFIKKGDKIKIKDTKDSPISVLRLLDHFTGGKIKTKGLKWEGNTFYKQGLPSISNRIKDNYTQQNKYATLKVKKGKFILCTTQTPGIACFVRAATGCF